MGMVWTLNETTKFATATAGVVGYDTIIDSPNKNQFFKDKCLKGILGIIFFFAFFFFFSSVQYI